MQTDYEIAYRLVRRLARNARLSNSETCFLRALEPVAVGNAFISFASSSNVDREIDQGCNNQVLRMSRLNHWRYNPDFYYRLPF